MHCKDNVSLQKALVVVTVYTGNLASLHIKGASGRVADGCIIAADAPTDRLMQCILMHPLHAARQRSKETMQRLRC